MASLNKVIIAGHLTRDVEIRYTPTGRAIGRMGMALNHVYYTQQDEKREEVSFVDIDCFGAKAETLAKYVSKGTFLIVEGRLKQDSWEDRQTGQKRSRLLVILESFTFAPSGQDSDRSGHDSRGQSAGGRTAPQGRGAERTQPDLPQEDQDEAYDPDDDVPF